MRLTADRLLLRLPVVGGLLQEVLAARFTRVLGTLLLNGVSLIAALGDRAGRAGQPGGAAGGGAGRRRRAAAGPDRRRWPRRAFSRRAPSICCASARKPRSLAAMALRAADIHEEKTRLAMQRLVALLVPAITMVMGLAVGGIVASLMPAMLSLNNLAGGG